MTNPPTIDEGVPRGTAVRQDDQPDLFDEELQKLLHDITIGFNIALSLGSKDSGINYVLAQARQEAITAAHELLLCDLNSPEGLETARHYQREFQRYLALFGWVVKAGRDADEAQQRAESEYPEWWEGQHEEALRKLINVPTARLQEPYRDT